MAGNKSERTMADLLVADGGKIERGSGGGGKEGALIQWSEALAQPKKGLSTLGKQQFIVLP